MTYRAWPEFSLFMRGLRDKKPIDEIFTVFCQAKGVVPIYEQDLFECGINGGYVENIPMCDPRGVLSEFNNIRKKERLSDADLNRKFTEILHSHAITFREMQPHEKREAERHYKHLSKEERDRFHARYG